MVFCMAGGGGITRDVVHGHLTNNGGSCCRAGRLQVTKAAGADAPVALVTVRMALLGRRINLLKKSERPSAV